MKVEKVGRNEPCPCGSGKKYKQCHGAQSTQRQGRWVAVAIVGVLLLGAALFFNGLMNRDPDDVQPTGVWSEEHQHFH